MSSNKPTPRKLAVSNAKTGRRHRSDDEKLKIVQESYEDGVVQAQLARRHGISTSQLWDWRARYKAGLFEGRAEFSQVVVTQETLERAEDQARPADTCPDLLIEMGQRYRLTIPAGFDMDAVARLLRGLA
ncbi:MAG: transposase [Sedimentitalea sp.]